MIHYHGTPCGGKTVEAMRFMKGRHVLIPFSRPDDLHIASEVCRSFCLDNGAFTAWKSGDPVVEWEPFYQFVEGVMYHPGFDWALIPDVIDGSEEDNDRLINEWVERFGVGCDGVPVWHMHESLERLRGLVYKWPRIALGSSGEFATPGNEKWWGRMGEAMDSVCNTHGQPMCKLHGLRMLNPDIFERLPLSSADSTNVVQNANAVPRFGMYYSPNRSVRMEVIASRIEDHTSAAVWVPVEEKQFKLFKVVS